MLQARSASAERIHYRQIMRRLLPIFVVVISLFTLLEIWNLVQVSRNRLREEHSAGLERVENQLSQELGAIVEANRALVRDPAMIRFAQGNVSLLEQAAFRSSDLIATHEEYQSIRFILPDGRIQIETISQQGTPIRSIYDGEDMPVSDLVGGSLFDQLARAETDTPIVGTFRLQRDAADNGPNPVVVVFDVVTPIFAPDSPQPIGFMHMEVDARNLLSTIYFVLENNLLRLQTDRHVVLIDNNNHVVADRIDAPFSASHIVSADETQQFEDPYYDTLLELNQQHPEEIVTLWSSGIVYSSRDVIVTGAENVAWRLYATDRARTYFQPLILQLITVVLGAGLVLWLTFVMTRRLLRPLLRPIEQAEDVIHRLAERPDQVTSTLASTAMDNELVQAIGRLAQRLDNLNTELDRQVSRRNRDLQLVGRIGRETAAQSNLDALLKRAINMICVELGFYHAQIFLIDDLGENAVLRASRGEAGQKLIEKGHHLPVASHSIIGTTASEKRIVIVNDTQQNIEGLHGFNPLLPQTRAEMGVPLMVGEKVIGVLDIQSLDINAFRTEDSPTYQLIADQLAIAVNNEQLRAQAQQRIQQIDRLNRQLTRQAWEQVEDKLELQTNYGEEVSTGRLNAPINIRGEIIGTIKADLPDNLPVSEGDHLMIQSVADRVALAIENARLFQETQVSLTETSTLYQLSRQLNEANSLEEVLQAIILTVAPEASGGQVWLFEERSSELAPDWVRLTVDLPLLPRDNSVQFVNQRYQMSKYPFLAQLSSNQSVLIEDVTRISNIGGALVRLFHAIDAQAIAFIPLNMRGIWEGFISIDFAERHRFSEREQRVYDALIGQAGVAIDNRLLLQQTETALIRQEKLYAASRIINTAQSLQDVVQAAVVTSDEPRLDFWLALLEGAIHETGWPRQARIVAKSENSEVHSANEYHMIQITDDSPLKNREPLVLTDPGKDIEDVPRQVRWMRSLGLNFMAIFPLFSDNVPLALFYIVSKTSYSLSAEDYEVYRALTGQMSTQIQNRILLERTEEALNETRRLYVATRAISGAQNIESIYDAVAGHLAMPFLQRRTGEKHLPINVSLTILFAHPEPSVEALRLRYEFQWESRLQSTAEDKTGAFVFHEDAPFGPLIQQNDNALLLYGNINADAPEDLPALVTILREFNAVSAVVLPLWSGQRWFGVLIVRVDQPDLLDQTYARFAQAIADQVAIALENQHLQAESEFERERLFTILSTLPTGVLVLDPDNFLPQLHNQRVEELVNHPIDYSLPFSAENYNLFRTGTHMHYPDEELPIYKAKASGQQVQNDDVAVITGDIQTDLLISAAPIQNRAGKTLAIVAAFQDISTLRSMENTMQENLRETVLLYETQRTLAESETLDELFDNIIMQLAMQQPSDAFIILRDENTGQISLARNLVQPLQQANRLRAILTDDLVMIDDINRTVDLDDQARTALSSVHAASAMIVPLRSRTRKFPLGWMVIIDAEPEAFTSDQERIMTTVADMASTAIDNRYLVISTQNALQETASLYTAATTISRSRDLTELFDALEKALLAMEPDMWAGFLKEDEGYIQMFKSGFEASEENGFDFGALLQLPLRAQEGVFVQDIAMSTLGELENIVAKAGNIRSFAAVDLRIKDIPSGRLIVGYNESHRFTEGDTRFMNTLADSASVVVDNQVLLDQIQSTLQETSVLYQASKALLDTNNPDEIVDAIVNYLIEPHVDQVFIAVLVQATTWDSPSAAIEVIASWRADDSVDLLGVTLNQLQFPAWPLLTSPTVRTVRDIHDETIDLTEAERASIESLDARSVAIIPLRVGNRPIGIVWLGSQEPYDYHERDLRIFQAFAEQTSLTMETARLLDQTEQRARQLQTSAAISQRVGQILDLNELLPEVVNLIRDQFNYDHVQIFLADEENEWSVLQASTGEAGEKLLAINHRLRIGSDSVIGRVMADAEPTIALDTADAAVVHQPNPYLPLTRSEMALPLILQNKVVGALDVQSNQPNAFTDDDTKALTTLAAQIAVAIDNARLYEESQSRAADMGFLFEITTFASTSETLGDALQAVSEQVQFALDAQTVAIFMPQLYEDFKGNQKNLMEVIALASEAELNIDDVESIEVGDTDNLIGVVSSTRNSQIVPNIERDIRYYALDKDARSAILVPIGSGNTLVGLIVMESHRLNAFDNDSLTLLLTLAGSLAAIIQNTRLLEQLGETVEQLREVDRLKSQFLASMSHELRTPLNSIIGFSRVMLKGIDGPLTEMQEQDLTTIYNSGNHLLNLINDILDQAKIEANELNLKFAHFDVKPMIEAVKSIAIGMIKETPLQLDVEVSPHMPEAFGDEFRSRQILLNLASNAIKFTTEGSVTIRAYTIEAEQGQMIRIDVTDSGIGIDEKDMPILFEQFRQIDNSLTRTVGGTGLGLPISKSLAEMQGGTLTVESEINVGSTFSVTIPCYVGAEEALERSRDEKRQQLAQPALPAKDVNTTGLISKEDVERALKIGKAKEELTDLFSKEDTQEVVTRPATQPTRSDLNVTQAIPIMAKQRLVLLIEDSKDMVDQFRRTLQREGFDVQTADFPAYAEAMVGQLRPSVVIMDVNFADGKGWELLQNLKARDDSYDIPIVVTTLDDNEERAYELGAFSFIQRPFLPDDLLEAVLEAEKESQRERILIIDDDPESIRLLSQVLADHSDFRVFSADSGEDGISLVARRHPDLIILDLWMEGKDGFNVLDELRSNPETARIPVLIVTGDPDLNAEQEEKLADILVIPKSEINQDTPLQFIDNIRDYLNIFHGKM